MTLEIEKTSKPFFSIEGFIRACGNSKAILELDEIILRDDISDSEKMKQVNQLISGIVKTVKEGILENER